MDYKYSKINVSCFCLWIIGLIISIGFGSKFVDDANKLSQDRCFVFFKEDCTYFVTAESCGTEAQLTYKDCDEKKSIENAHDCWLAPDACESKEFTFETPGSGRTRGAIMIVSSILFIIWFSCWCMKAINEWEYNELMICSSLGSLPRKRKSYI